MVVETLRAYTKALGVGPAAEALGVTADSVYKAMRNGRSVWVVRSPCGAVEAFEIREFPAGIKHAA